MLRTLEFTGLGKQVSKNGKYLDKTKNEYRKSEANSDRISP